MAIEISRGTATARVYDRLRELAKVEGVGLATLVGGLLLWACTQLSDEEVMVAYGSLLLARRDTRGGGPKRKISATGLSNTERANREDRETKAKRVRTDCLGDEEI